MWIKPVPILARTESCRSRATEFRWKGARDIRIYIHGGRSKQLFVGGGGSVGSPPRMYVRMYVGRKDRPTEPIGSRVGPPTDHRIHP